MSNVMCSILTIITLVKQDVTEEELDAIIDSDQQNQIFAQSVNSFYTKNFIFIHYLFCS